MRQHREVDLWHLGVSENKGVPYSEVLIIGILLFWGSLLFGNPHLLEASLGACPEAFLEDLGQARLLAARAAHVPGRRAKRLPWQQKEDAVADRNYPLTASHAREKFERSRNCRKAEMTRERLKKRGKREKSTCPNAQTT